MNKNQNFYECWSKKNGNGEKNKEMRHIFSDKKWNLKINSDQDGSKVPLSLTEFLKVLLLSLKPLAPFSYSIYLRKLVIVNSFSVLLRCKSS